MKSSNSELRAELETTHAACRTHSCTGKLPAPGGTGRLVLAGPEKPWHKSQDERAPRSASGPGARKHRLRHTGHQIRRRPTPTRISNLPGHRGRAAGRHRLNRRSQPPQDDPRTRTPRHGRANRAGNHRPSNRRTGSKTAAGSCFGGFLFSALATLAGHAAAGDLARDAESRRDAGVRRIMWATSREVRRTSRETLIQEAKANERLLSDENLEVLAQLPAREPLAVVRPGHTTPKANIRWIPRNGAPPTTKVRIAVLPLIMLGDHFPERLRKLPPTPAPKNSRAARTASRSNPLPSFAPFPYTDI